jgi:hypothetical protein
VQLVDEAVAAEARGFPRFRQRRRRARLGRAASGADRRRRHALPARPGLHLRHGPRFPPSAAEVEALVGEGLPVSPQIKGALKSLPGVVTVEEV